ncbi:MAG: DUF485 domain-containing protein [Corynebacterium sp.]|nr:DUF485 domain-containing protein [Corynebacterium sp.]
MTTSSLPPRSTPSAADFVEMQRSPEFQELRKKQRGFTFPLTFAFLAWYVIYILAAIYAPGFMSIELWGNINMGIVMGVLQFVTTFVITWAYVKYANSQLEPRATAIREELEAKAAGNSTSHPEAQAMQGDQP